jgi:hypothetical protein
MGPENKLKLITSFELFDLPSKQQLNEIRAQNDGKLVLRGIIQRADTLNQNGRVYPRDILEREVRNYQKLIIEKRAFGELDHPDSSTVSLKNVCLNMIEARMETDGVVYGAIEILNTPSGKIVQSLVDDGVKIGISSRGVGSTRRQGDYQIVNEDFQILAWDVVSDPSTPGAFMTLSEGRTLQPAEIKRLFSKSDRLYRVANEILFPAK